MSPQHVPVISKVTDSCVVIDNFLPAQVFEDIFHFCNSSDYRMVHAAKVQKVWRLHDGFPLQGDTYHYLADQKFPSSAARTYPTRSVLDGFIEAMLQSMEWVKGIVGEPEADWQELTLAPWVYPVGTGLSLHQDTGRSAPGRSYAGSYTFYVSPEWNLHWGGWLLVFDERPQHLMSQAPMRGSRVAPPWLGDDIEQEFVNHASVATAVLPAPNRIVFINPQAPHMITRVDQNAGHHARVSLAGFFLRNVQAATSQR